MPLHGRTRGPSTRRSGPRAAAHLLAAVTVEGAVLVGLVVATGTEAAMLVVSFRPEPPD
jgi:hypothetical protein